MVQQPQYLSTPPDLSMSIPPVAKLGDYCGCVRMGNPTKLREWGGQGGATGGLRDRPTGATGTQVHPPPPSSTIWLSWGLFRYFHS
ncbi:hypothetical protein JTE90_000650 [Oedothorax gibbosus]|uniref:Uncharacterized protein n=1 Tax=Oedothorax gibbosus TaxID=931172 RepID=A0AAV6VV10_9ARAC|nr:hypothetical protein JTE90_000650 [Oedothorax gibbosus]